MTPVRLVISGGQTGNVAGNRRRTNPEASVQARRVLEEALS